MSSSAGPLKSARLITLALAWCFACISGAVGLNALIRSNQDKSRLSKLAPPPSVVQINTSDIFNVGVVASTASLVISILVFNFAIGMYLSSTKALVARTLRLQAIVLTLACLWLFASMIPYMVYYLHRGASVKAFINGVQLPDSVVKQVVAASGSPTNYKDISYLKLVAIFPWLSLFSGLVAAGTLFVASSRTDKMTPPASPATRLMEEKEDVSHHEKTSVV